MKTRNSLKYFVNDCILKTQVKKPYKMQIFKFLKIINENIIDHITLTM